jgi:parallel beta-helix repeat protein
MAAGGAATNRTIRVTSLKDSGLGTLRRAIQQANRGGRRTRTTIDFSVAGTIRLATPLPAITADVVIDGTSAPGYAAGGPPVIGIDCHGRAGLDFASGSAGSELLAVAVEHATGDGVSLRARGITLNLDYIGVALNGSAAGNRGSGVYVAARSGRDRIGLNPSGMPGTVGNVISANGGNGIVLAGSSDNTIADNRIGTSPAGTAAMANRGNGILLTGAADRNEIGGTEYTDPSTGAVNNPTGSKGTVPPVFVVPALGNLVSGNRGNGVDLSRGPRHNTLNGNFVGTTANGDQRLGNAGDGVLIDRANDNSLIGCKFVNNPFVYYNVLSGNGDNGLRITSSASVVVQGNFFGVGANNTTQIGNRRDGILVDGWSSNTQVGGVIPLGNVSAANGTNGIEVAGHVHGFVTFNTFGGLLAFKGAAPNHHDGLLVTATGGDNLARTNVFSGNTGNGIELAGNATGVTVDPDIAGLSTNGKSQLANGGDGLLIDGNAHGNTIGGSRRSVIPQDTFSGNHRYGVEITGRAHDNRVFGNFIGTEITGFSALGNGKGGVLIAGHAYANTVGDARKIPANLISGNTGNGVTLSLFTRFNRIIRNYIGLNRIGRRLPNSGRPVVNRGTRNIIRGNR